MTFAIFTNVLKNLPMRGGDCDKTLNVFIVPLARGFGTVPAPFTERAASSPHGRQHGPERQKGVPMNTDIVQGKWLQVRGAIKQALGKATEDRVLVYSGE